MHAKAQKLLISAQPATSNDAPVRQCNGGRPDRAAPTAEPQPGDARELRARTGAALPIAEDGLTDAVGALLLAAPGGEPPSFREAKRAFEVFYVRRLLQRCRGNISQAARLARKDRKDFYDVLRRTGISASQYREIAEPRFCGPAAHPTMSR